MKQEQQSHLIQPYEKLQACIYQWAFDKNLLRSENALAQFAKVNEEVGEIAQALLNNNRTDLKDGIGDSMVTLIILAYQNDLNPLDCLNTAWNEIKDRTGKTIDGTFIKD